MKRIVAVLGMLGALVLVPVAPAGAGGGGCHGPQTQGSGTVVEIKQGCFTPSELHAEVGDAITFTNRDSYEHVVIGVGWGDYDLLGDGDTTTNRFDEAGLYPYSCYLHPGMNGVVVVGGGDGVEDVEETAGAELAANVGPVTGDGSTGFPLAAVVAAGATGLAGFAGGRWAQRRRDAEA